VADALHTARQGVAKHPGYLAGQRALAMACNANGLQEESRTILEQVTAAVPEDVDAQKLLAGLYIDAGDKSSAIRAYTTLLDFSPDDEHCKAHLENLRQAATGERLQIEPPSGPVVYNEKIDENPEIDVYELSEDDIVYDDDEEEEEVAPDEPPVINVSSPVHHDPLSTHTLAELYEKQGFIAKALDIYRSILADDPHNAHLLGKVSALESQISTSHNTTEQPATTDPNIEHVHLASAALVDVSPPLDSQDFSLLSHQTADNVVGTLDSWLENIRRIKACR